MKVNKEMSVEELDELKQKYVKEWEKQIPYLKTQEEYTGLIAKIAMNEAQRLQAIAIVAKFKGDDSKKEDKTE